MWREIRHTITAPGRVDSSFGGVRIPTGHPDPANPGDCPPPPWFLFLASIGACITSFVAGTLAELEVDPTGVEVIQRQDYAPDDDVIPELSFVIRVPAGLSAGAREVVLAAARRCTVKRVIEAAPAFRIQVE